MDTQVLVLLFATIVLFTGIVHFPAFDKASYGMIFGVFVGFLLNRRNSSRSQRRSSWLKQRRSRGSSSSGSETECSSSSFSSDRGRPVTDWLGTLWQLVCLLALFFGLVRAYESGYLFEYMYTFLYRFGWWILIGSLTGGSMWWLRGFLVALAGIPTQAFTVPDISGIVRLKGGCETPPSDDDQIFCHETQKFYRRGDLRLKGGADPPKKKKRNRRKKKTNNTNKAAAGKPKTKQPKSSSLTNTFKGFTSIVSSPWRKLTFTMQAKAPLDKWTTVANESVQQAIYNHLGFKPDGDAYLEVRYHRITARNNTPGSALALKIFNILSVPDTEYNATRSIESYARDSTTYPQCTLAWDSVSRTQALNASETAALFAIFPHIQTDFTVLKFEVMYRHAQQPFEQQLPFGLESELATLSLED